MMWPSLCRLRLALPLLGLVAALCNPVAHAGPFEIAISPSRFELSGRNTQRIGQSMDIQNLGGTATEVSVRTIDWTYSPEGHITYHDALLPGSCRPWVTLERKLVRVPARGKAAFRFQVDVPVDAQRDGGRQPARQPDPARRHRPLADRGQHPG